MGLIVILRHLAVLASLFLADISKQASKIDPDLLEKLNLVEDELSILQSKQKMKNRLKEFKVFSKEIRIFENKANLIYKGHESEEWIHFALLQGYSTRQKHFDKYNNLFFFFGGAKKIKILDLSGGLILEEELDEKIKFYFLVQESIRQMPKVRF